MLILLLILLILLVLHRGKIIGVFPVRQRSSHLSASQPARFY